MPCLVSLHFEWVSVCRRSSGPRNYCILWGSPFMGFRLKVKGKAVLSFDIWLHHEVISFYPTLASRCNSLNKKGPKRIIRKKTATDRRRRRFFYIFPLFPGFNNHSLGEGVFPEFNWNGWIFQLRCLKIR